MLLECPGWPWLRNLCACSPPSSSFLYTKYSTIYTSCFRTLQLVNHPCPLPLRRKFSPPTELERTNVTYLIRDCALTYSSQWKAIRLLLFVMLAAKQTGGQLILFGCFLQESLRYMTNWNGSMALRRSLLFYRQEDICFRVLWVSSLISRLTKLWLSLRPMLLDWTFNIVVTAFRSDSEWTGLLI